MAAVKELLRTEENNTLSFGDYTLDAKSKVEDYEFAGNLYKVKTFKEITKLERDGAFVYESVPGTAVNGFKKSEDGVEFTVSGDADAEITIGLSENTEYEVVVAGRSNKMSTGISGKLSFSVNLEGEGEVSVKICK
ncbi:MAG: endosialidase [Lachnospiraceae bacterium]|nr:endosialidase [Lachnospiraceae bacterium]